MSMLSAKTPRPRGGSKSRRRFTPPATKAQAAAAAAAAAGISPSGELSQKLEHVTLFSYLADRPPAAHKPFGELLDEESHGSAPAPPPPPPQPMDADVPMEDRDCCILSQDFFW
jgi:wee1-like protein kinase